MAGPSVNDLNMMGWVYNGEPFIEYDAVDGLTSPGYMGIVYQGEPQTYLPAAFAVPPGGMAFPSTAKILTRGLNVGPMGLKIPHFP